MEGSDQNNNHLKTNHYITYSTRWIVMLCTVSLNFAGYMLAISYGPIATQATTYFEVDGNMIDMISITGMFFNVIGLFIAIYALDKHGVLIGLRWGGTFLLFGTTVRMLVTFPAYQQNIDPNTQFWLGYAGNAVASLGHPILITLATKVSQVWFSERERIFATAAMAMSLPVGAMIGSIVSSAVVSDPGDIPTLNIIYPCFTLVGFLIAWVGVRTPVPPTPPSPSAERLTAKKPITPRDMLVNLRVLWKSNTMKVYVLSYGAGAGLINTLTSQLGQTMCVQGYNSQAAGLASACLILSGVFGAFIIGGVARRTQKQAMLAMLSFCLACLAVILVCLSLRYPDFLYGILISLALFGFFGFGGFPLGLELAVEETYPIDPVVSEGLIHASGQIQGIILILMGNWSAMHWEIDSDTDKRQTCKLPGEEGGVEPHDYTPYFYFIMSFTTVMAVAFVLLARPKMRRSNIDQQETEAQLGK